MSNKLKIESGNVAKIVAPSQDDINGAEITFTKSGEGYSISIKSGDKTETLTAKTVADAKRFLKDIEDGKLEGKYGDAITLVVNDGTTDTEVDLSAKGFGGAATAFDQV